MNGSPLEESIKKFVVATTKWNKDVSGNILKRKRILLIRLGGIQICLERYRSRKLIELEKDLPNLNRRTVLSK